MSFMIPRVLCLLIPGFEEIETVTPVDLLRRAGAEVILASVTGEKLVRGRCDMVLQADATLAEVAEQEFDLLFLPGGPGVKLLRSDGRAARLAREFVGKGKPVAAICAAPLVLADAGLLAGRRYTAHSSVWNDLPESVHHEAVVEHGPLITSQGAGTAVTFGLALVQRLFGMPKGDEIARDIML